MHLNGQRSFEFFSLHLLDGCFHPRSMPAFLVLHSDPPARPRSFPIILSDIPHDCNLPTPDRRSPPRPCTSMLVQNGCVHEEDRHQRQRGRLQVVRLPNRLSSIVSRILSDLCRESIQLVVNILSVSHSFHSSLGSSFEVASDRNPRPKVHQFELTQKFHSSWPQSMNSPLSSNGFCH